VGGNGKICSADQIIAGNKKGNPASKRKIYPTAYLYATNST